MLFRSVKGAAGMAAVHLHRKVYQAEHENVGIKAAHRTEIVGEAGVRTAYRLHKASPYRKVARLQKKAAGTEAKAAYAKLLQTRQRCLKHQAQENIQKCEYDSRYTFDQLSDRS